MDTFWDRIFEGVELSKVSCLGSMEIVSCLSRCPYFSESAFRVSTVDIINGSAFDVWT